MFRSLPLSRTTLLSLITICATVALFATGATFAITGSDDAVGKVTAASAAITVDGSNTDGSISFEAGATGCSGALLPGDECGPDTVTVTNVSTGALTLTGPIVALAVTNTVNPIGCNNTTDNWVVTTTGITPSSLLPGEDATFEVRVRLQALAHEGCQGETATVTVTVNSVS